MAIHPNPSAPTPRRDPLQVCGVCEGQRILVDVVGQSVCGWCDGTGLELSNYDEVAQVLEHVTRRLDVLRDAG